MNLKDTNSTKGGQVIFIIGNGVIGKALAVALSLSGKKVTMLRGSIDQVPDHQESIEVDTGDQILKGKITVSCLSSHSRLEGIIVLTNKSFGNEQLANKLRDKALGCPIVFLQNGLNIEASFIKHGFTDLYRCILLSTSQSVTETKIRFRQVASSPVGIISGKAEVLHHIIDEMNTPVFSFRSETDIQSVIWKKAITNCVFNSICPLLEIDNGVFHRNEAALDIAKSVISECINVSREIGINLTANDVLENVLSISKLSDGQKISTYQDILNGRETEIDTFNFAVDRIANSTGKVSVPLTTLLGQMIKIKADLFKKQTI